MNRLPRKRLVVIVTAVLLLTGGGIAFAYWSAGGSGTGSASAGTTVAITANQTSTVTGMAPGDSAQTLSGDFDNPNSGPVYVTSVVASISSVDKAVGAPAGTCDATDFTLANATMTVDAEVASGTGVGSWTGATIQFNDKAGTNQDACKGATVNLAYTVN
jgi:hypothetical protein